MDWLLFIRKAVIDWNYVDDDSYLFDIPAISDMDEIEFHAPITLLAGENGMGKSTLLEAMAVAAGFNPEGGTRNYAFSTYNSHSDLCNAMKLVKSGKKTNGVIFFVPRVSIMSQLRKMNIAKVLEVYQNIFMKCHMVKVSLELQKANSVEMDFIFWMSQKQRCLRNDSWPC